MPPGSFIHAPYCRFHLRSVLKLDVDNSTIPGAGRGLFSLVDRPVGFPLVDYMGELISAEETERRYPLNSSGTYCLKISNSFFIDSALSRGIGALINHPGKGMKPNVKFVVCTRKRSARLETIEKVKAGDEIFVSYGDDYWKDAAKSSHFTVDIPDWEWDLSDPFAPAAAPPSPPGQSSTPPPRPLNIAPTADVHTLVPAVSPSTVITPEVLDLKMSPAPDEFDFKDGLPSRPSSCLSPGPRYTGPLLDDPSARSWPFSVCPDWPISNDWLRFAFAPVTFTFDEEAEESASFSKNSFLCLDNDSLT